MSITERIAGVLAQRAVTAWGPYSEDPSAIPPNSMIDAAPAWNTLSPTLQSAMRAQGVAACVDVIASDVSTLPVRRIREDGAKRTRIDAPSLFTEPHPEIPSWVDWCAMQIAALVLRGNCFGLVREVDEHGASAVLPLDPDAVAPSRRPEMSGRLQWRVAGTLARMPEYLDPWPRGDLWHVRGISLPGTDLGINPIQARRLGLTTSIAAEEFAANLFTEGALPSSALTIPDALPDTAEGRRKARRIIRDFERTHGNGHRRTALLQNGVTWQRMSITPEEAQFLDTRRFTLEDVARMFRVKPHKIGILDRATFSNIEQQAIEHVTDTLRPWIVRFETAVDRLFIGDPSSDRTRIDVNGLLRGDIKSRYEAYAIGRQWGIDSTNDILALEDRDPIGEDGDTRLMPLNMRAAHEASLSEKAKALGDLVLAGFDPDAAAAAVGLQGLPHTGKIPGTLKDPSAKPAPNPFLSPAQLPPDPTEDPTTDPQADPPKDQ